MEINPILQNVLAPPVLFFLIGATSVLFKSDLNSTDIAPIKKKRTGGANTFCRIGLISISF